MYLNEYMADYPKEKIVFWLMQEITEDSRIYYKPNKQDDGTFCGFYFVIVRWISTDSDSDVWDNPEISVEYSGTASYDGMRHLYQGSEETDNKGYLYYPSMKNHIKYFETLLKLTRIYCLGFGDDYEYYNVK